jgi:hypothetical protein
MLVARNTFRSPNAGCRLIDETRYVRGRRARPHDVPRPRKRKGNDDGLRAYVSTLTTITADRLARLKPIHETHEGADIASAFGAIEAAEPAPSTESSEPRWHLTFADKSGAAILVVTTASSAPWHGTIEGHRVAYRTDRLVKWLTDRYAPDEASAVR